MATRPGTEVGPYGSLKTPHGSGQRVSLPRSLDGEEAGRCAPVTSTSPDLNGPPVLYTQEPPLSLQPPDRPPLL